MTSLSPAAAPPLHRVLAGAPSAPHPVLAVLPRYVRDHSHWVIEVPARILVVILVAVLVRVLLDRSIRRLVQPRRPGDLPGILTPFHERAHADAGPLQAERRAQRAATIGSVLTSAMSFAVFVVTVMVVLSELGVDLGPFIAGTSVVGVALGFGAQSIVKDFLAGMFMMLEDQYGVGDVIDFQLASGVVETVGLRTTRLRDGDGTVWYVRNGEVLRVGNRSQGYARVVLDVPVPAAADLDEAGATMLAAARAMRTDPAWQADFLGDPELEGVESMTLDQSTLRLVARVRAGTQFTVARELRRRIRPALSAAAVPSDG